MRMNAPAIPACPAAMTGTEKPRADGDLLARTGGLKAEGRRRAQPMRTVTFTRAHRYNAVRRMF